MQAEKPISCVRCSMSGIGKAGNKTGTNEGIYENEMADELTRADAIMKQIVPQLFCGLAYYVTKKAMETWETGVH